MLFTYFDIAEAIFALLGIAVLIAFIFGVIWSKLGG